MRIKLGILMVLCACALGSCRTKKVVTDTYTATHDTLYQNIISHDTVLKVLHKVDSILLHDSIYEKEFLQGDTVVRYKYVQNTKYIDRLKHDTIFKTSVRHDTTYVAKTDTVTVNKEVTKTRTPFLAAAKGAVTGVIVSALLAFCYWVYKNKNNG